VLTSGMGIFRLREAMRERFADTGSKLGDNEKTVEGEGTFVGGKDRKKHAHKRAGRGGMNKELVFALVERRGRVRSHHVPAVDADTLRPILQAQLDGASVSPISMASRRSSSIAGSLRGKRSTSCVGAGSSINSDHQSCLVRWRPP
jgi:ISXO2-like transposase domain